MENYLIDEKDRFDTRTGHHHSHADVNE